MELRTINDLTTIDSYPFSPFQQMLDDLSDSKIFTSLDARRAFWAIPVEEADRSKTALSDGARVWQLRRMPYEMRTAPQTFRG